MQAAAQPRLLNTKARSRAGSLMFPAPEHSQEFRLALYCRDFYSGSESGAAEHGIRAQQHPWRSLEVEQRVLDNARVLWQRYVDQNRQDANDRANQLKNLAKLSAIIAGFSMSSFLEFNFDPNTVPSGLLMAYGLTTAAVAANFMCCMTMCNLMLGTVLQVSSHYVTQEEESNFLLQCREFAIRYRKGDRPPAPRRSFRRLWDFRCGIAWRVTLIMFTAGVPVFLVMMAVASWVKFAEYHSGAVLMTIIMGLALVYLAVVHSRWVTHLIQAFQLPAQHEVAVPKGLPWDWHLAPRLYPLNLQVTGPLAQNDDDSASKWDEAQVEQWRREDMQQQHLDNAMVLWRRYVMATRNEVEERAEQLRSLSFLAGIMLSFGMAALYQLTFTVTQFPPVLNILYSVTIGFTVALNICALINCSFLNMAIVKACAALVCEDEQGHFLARCQRFVEAPELRGKPPHPMRTFDGYWARHCEADWQLAYLMFTLGALVFQLCLVCSAWLKFVPKSDPTVQAPASDHLEAAVAMTVVLGAGILTFCVLNLRWRYMTSEHHSKEQVKASSQPLSVGLPFDWHLPATKRDSLGQQVAQVGELRTFQPSADSPYQAVVGTGWLQGEQRWFDGDGNPWREGGTSSWREQNLQQRHLLNSLALWKRFVDKNFNDLEERQEQLKAVTELAAVISGFEMIAYLQFEFDSTQIAGGLQLAYVATSGLTVALMACAMTMCGVMLESILETSSRFVSPTVEADFIFSCQRFCQGFRLGDRPPEPRRSFRNHWETRCESEWRRAFYMFSIGVPMFLANAAVSAWINWFTNRGPAIAVTVMQGAAIVYLGGSHARWVKHLLGSSKRPSLQDMESKLTPAGLPFDFHLPPGPHTSARRGAGIKQQRGRLSTTK